MNELIPCPTCGSKDIDSEFWMAGQHRNGPGCMQCGTMAETVEIWNTRPTETILTEDLDEAEAAVKEERERADLAVNTLQALDTDIMCGTCHVDLLRITRNGLKSLTTDNEEDN